MMNAEGGVLNGNEACRLDGALRLHGVEFILSVAQRSRRTQDKLRRIEEHLIPTSFSCVTLYTRPNVILVEERYA
jgi:hypothetical protein